MYILYQCARASESKNNLGTYDFIFKEHVLLLICSISVLRDFF